MEKRTTLEKLNVPRKIPRKEKRRHLKETTTNGGREGKRKEREGGRQGALRMSREVQLTSGFGAQCSFLKRGYLTTISKMGGGGG